jgi:hypothetical protein
LFEYIFPCLAIAALVPPFAKYNATLVSMHCFRVFLLTPKDLQSATNIFSVQINNTFYKLNRKLKRRLKILHDVIFQMVFDTHQKKAKYALFTLNHSKDISIGGYMNDVSMNSVRALIFII